MQILAALARVGQREAEHDLVRRRHRRPGRQRRVERLDQRAHGAAASVQVVPHDIAIRERARQRAPRARVDDFGALRANRGARVRVTLRREQLRGGERPRRGIEQRARRGRVAAVEEEDAIALASRKPRADDGEDGVVRRLERGVLCGEERRVVRVAFGEQPTVQFCVLLSRRLCCVFEEREFFVACYGLYPLEIGLCGELLLRVGKAMAVRPSSSSSSDATF